LKLEEALKVSEVERSLDENYDQAGAVIYFNHSKITTKNGRGGIFLMTNLGTGGSYYITPSNDIIESEDWSPL